MAPNLLKSIGESIPMSLPTSTEADARIVIDDQLRAAGWNPADKSQIRTEVLVKLPTSLGVAEPRATYAGIPGEAQPDASGRADYVLYSQNGRPLAIIEAKKHAIHPYVAKQ